MKLVIDRRKAGVNLKSIGIIKESHDIVGKTHRKPTFSDITWPVIALVFYK